MLGHPSRPALAQSNETVEKVQTGHFHGKATLENKGIIGTDFFDFRVFRQSQRWHAGDGLQSTLRAP